MSNVPKDWKEPAGGHDNTGAILDDDVNKKQDSSSSSPPPPSSQQPQQSNTNSTGCFKRALLHIWATRQTLDVANNKDLKLKTTFRELFIYCLFLVVVCVMTLGMTNPLAFCYTNVLDILFVQTPADPTNPGSNFLGMNLHSDFFDFVEQSFIANLFGSWEKVYNGNNASSTDGYGLVYYENKLQGVPRIRQVRVRSNSCLIPEDFQSQIKACYAAYSERSVDMSPFGGLNGTAWTYSSEEQLKGSSISTDVNSYDGGGFYQDLNTTSYDSLKLIKILKENLWVDRATRAVFIDFTVYNANINLFCSVKLIAEFPPTGGIIPSFIFRPTKLIRYNSTMDFIVLGFEIAFCVFVIYYIIEEIIELKKLGCAYLKEFWNILDILVLIIAICCIAFNIYCYIKVKKLLDIVFLMPDEYIDFDFLTYWQMIFNAAQAVMVFVAWIKIFKYISFSKTMSQLNLTLGASSKDLTGFSVMFFIVFLAFAQLGYLMFGTQVNDFNTFSSAIFTLFRIILGDFNFQSLQQANRVLGPVYFILYVFFVFFVLLNMFLAIINDTYAEVKADMASKPSEIDVKKFFRERADRLLEKLHLKRSKLIGFESAISTADTNNDNMIDFDEWKSDLKARGYADVEIEAVFAKYDKSGDRRLDQNELKKLQQDLSDQKLFLSRNISNIEDKEAYHKELKNNKVEDGYHSGDEDMEPSNEDVTNLKTRVDKLENTIGSIVARINSVLNKLEDMEKAKVRRRENIGRVLEDITESNDLTDDMAQQEVERVFNEELKKWEKEPFAMNRIN